MCGRVVQKTPLDEIRVLFETVNPIPNTAATYNGAPTDRLAVVRLGRDGRRSLDLLRWGLIPYWAKDKAVGPRCINLPGEFRLRYRAPASAGVSISSSRAALPPRIARRPGSSRPLAPSINPIGSNSPISAG
jgi:SOS response associated peptidase (SRAP)